MKLCFDTVDELRAFVKEDLKAKRGAGKSDEAESGNAPAPLAPPAGGVGFPGTGTAGFAPPAGGAGPQGGAFPAAGASGLAPEVLALVTRISARIDGAIASGQPAEQVLQWFRGQCGPDAAQATMDHIKTIFLPRMPQARLEEIAKLMAA